MRSISKKAVVIFFIIMQTAISSLAQEIKSSDKKQKGGGNHCISLSILRPLGDFSSTQFGGLAVGYQPANHVFNLFKRHFALTYNAGLAYYFGKKETVSGYPYKYPGYFFLHVFGGVLYTPVSKLDLTLTMGPALSNYNGKSGFTIGSRLEATYYFKNNFAISPGIILMKENQADPLWAASIKAILEF